VIGSDEAITKITTIGDGCFTTATKGDEVTGIALLAPIYLHCTADPATHAHFLHVRFAALRRFQLCHPPHLLDSALQPAGRKALRARERERFQKREKERVPVSRNEVLCHQPTRTALGPLQRNASCRLPLASCLLPSPALINLCTNVTAPALSNGVVLVWQNEYRHPITKCDFPHHRR
jgi:hypothetical protein